MSNGDETYKVTVGDWIAMEKILERLNGRMDQSEKTDKRMLDTMDGLTKTMSGVNETLNNLPCDVHLNQIKTLENQPSATKAVYVIGGLITLILSVYALVNVIG